MATPIPQLILAYEGKFDYARLTNPFGSPPKKKETDKPQRTPAEREAFINSQRTALALMRAKAKQDVMKNRDTDG